MPADRSALLAAHGHAIEAHDALQAIADDRTLPTPWRARAESLRVTTLALARDLGNAAASRAFIEEIDEEARNAPR